MAIFKTGEMFKAPDLKIVKTNSFITRQKKIVMGMRRALLPFTLD